MQISPIFDVKVISKILHIAYCVPIVHKVDIMNEGTFIDSAKVFGKGKIQVPVDVRGILHLDDGDKIIFYQDTQGRVFLEKAPTLKKKALGKYR